jgi:lipopolysaccharide biosynthesis glycosyltransferase
MINPPYNVYIGHDDREDKAFRVAEYSIRKQTKAPLHTVGLRHKALRARGLFTRPWIVDGPTGNYRDYRDSKPFSTQFAFTRFLVPYLQGYEGWALFMDCDMLVIGDIEELFALADDRYAVQVVKHNHIPQNSEKMDGCEQAKYWRKNWSSVILFNCGHEANRKLSLEVVNSWPGYWLHTFSWLKNELIGEIPPEWNFLVGHTTGVRYPKILHFTDGGPWMENWKDVPYGANWIQAYHAMQRHIGDLDENPDYTEPLVTSERGL